MARGVHEPVTLSQGRFGVVEALPRILALLRAAEIRATFFIPAWVAARYADAVRAIAGDGHEIGCHGDEHERVTDLGPGREKEILLKSLEVLTPLAGRRPIGYRAPAWQLSADTLALLASENFDYSSNMMDRLAPYLHPPVGGRSLVEIPVSWVLDDAPFFLFSGQRSMQPPGPVLQGWLTGMADGVRGHHRGPRRHELHLPPAAHRTAVPAGLSPRADRPRPPHAAGLDRLAGRDQRPLEDAGVTAADIARVVSPGERSRRGWAGRQPGAGPRMK